MVIRLRIYTTKHYVINNILIIDDNNYRNNNGLLTEISGRGFLVWNELRRSEDHGKKKGLIFHSTDRTSEVNNRFIISAELSL